jgi:hypothetical protein
MKTYLVSTCAVFGLITAAHVWRVAEEGRHLMVQPFFAGMTLVSASLCLWAGSMLWRGRR